MKKSPLIFVILVLLLGTVCLTNTFAVEVEDEDLLVEPDPENPFQGTWISKGIVTYIHVIKGMKGEWYVYSLDDRNWIKKASYTIKPNSDGFVTSNNWKISITNDKNGEILTVVKSKYKRYVHK